MTSLKGRAAAAACRITLDAGACTVHPFKLTATELQSILQAQQGPSSRPTIIDVRGEADFQAGHIPGSLNCPFQELDYRRLVEQHAAATGSSGVGGPQLIFISAESPDLDDLAAREYIMEYERVQQTPPADGRVAVLCDGLNTWLQLYGPASP